MNARGASDEHRLASDQVANEQFAFKKVDA